MFLMVIQLYKTEYKEDVLLALTSMGIESGSLIDGINLDQELTRDFPLFTGLVRSDSEKARFSLQITAVVENKGSAQMLMSLLKEADIDIRKEPVLRIMLLPMAFYADEETLWDPMSSEK